MTLDDADFRTDSQQEGQKPTDLTHPADRYSETGGPAWHLLAEFNLLNEASREILAKRSTLAVIEAVRFMHLPAERLAGLRASVESAVLNAVEHRDQLHPEQPVTLCIFTPERADSNGIKKIAGPPRGWGYFFIEKITKTNLGETHPVVQLFLYQEGSL